MDDENLELFADDKKISDCGDDVNEAIANMILTKWCDNMNDVNNYYTGQIIIVCQSTGLRLLQCLLQIKKRLIFLQLFF